jgi:ABC-2 type transport system permease protein
MSIKTRVVTPFTYLGVLIFPLTIAVLALVLLSPQGGSRTAYAVLGGGLIGFWGNVYIEGGNDIQNERWAGTLEQILGCPTPLAWIMVGKVLASLVYGLLSFVPTIFIAYVFWHARLQHIDAIPFGISFLVLGFSFFAMTIALAPIFAMWRWAFSFVNGFEIGVYALCGFMFPTSQLPNWLQAASTVLAPRWATQAFYAATNQPRNASYFALWALAVTLSLVYLMLSLLLFRILDVRARVSGQMALA